MNDEEMNRIIAEKVMGFHWVADYGTGHYSPTGAWLDSSGGVQYWTEVWEPTENVAQAIEAVEGWRGNIKGRFWKLESPFHHPDGDIDKEFQVFIHWDDDYYHSLDALGETPALAICNALVKAVSDE